MQCVLTEKLDTSENFGTWKEISLRSKECVWMQMIIPFTNLYKTDTSISKNLMSVKIRIRYWAFSSILTTFVAGQKT